MYTADSLLKAALRALNQIPNRKINADGFDNTYKIAEAIDEHFKAQPKKTGEWRCENCGSNEVHGTAWIDLNTGEDTGDEPPLTSNWCVECGSETNADWHDFEKESAGTPPSPGAR